MNQYICNHFVSFYAGIIEVLRPLPGITKPTKPALTRVIGYRNWPLLALIFTKKADK